MQTTAYLLVSHGSSDPRHQAGLSRLAKGMRQHLSRLLREEYQPAAAVLHGRPGVGHPFLSSSSIAPGNLTEIAPQPFAHSRLLSPDAIIVGTATLEANELPLSQQIVNFAQQMVAQGIRQVVVIPLFLLAGIHVKEDLPQELAAARSQLPSRLRLNCMPYLGSQASFQQFVAHRLTKTDAERCVLLAHGSRRSAGNRAIQQLGKGLNAEVAFWSVAPDLETQVYDLMRRGYQKITIAPYFLFPGSITDAITRRTEELAEQFPKLSLRLLSPLGISADLSKAIAELAAGVPHKLTATSRSQSAHPIAENGITA